MSENYGHLSRQLKEVFDRSVARDAASAGYDFGVKSDLAAIGFLIPEINRLERIVHALESIGVNLDKEDIVALEWIAEEYGTTHSDRSWLRDHLNKAIGEAAADMRHTEQKEAIEALARAGFVMNEDDGETWTRNDERVTIELANGRESRYRWTYESQDNGTHPLYKTDSGVSGDFHRLLALIGTEVTS